MKEKTSLKKIFAKHAAFLVVDVQARFCDPNGARGNYETNLISTRIQKLTPAFRKTGASLYAIFYSGLSKPKEEDADFFKFKPEAGDILIPKKSDSAFTNKKLQKCLKKNGTKTVFVLGVNFNACVCATARAAKQRGYQVYIVDNLTGNDNNNNYSDKIYARNMMKEEGIQFIDSAQSLKMLK
jgi:nicotinamidase-related amidase